MADAIVLLSGVNAATVGSSFEVAVGRTLAFAEFRSGPGTVSVSVEGSFDNSNWFALLTTGGTATSDMPVKYIRGNYSGSTSTGVVTLQAIQADVQGNEFPSSMDVDVTSLPDRITTDA